MNPLTYSLGYNPTMDGIIPTQVEDSQRSQDHRDEDPDHKTWGYLIPCNPSAARIDFFHPKQIWKVGRHPDLNDCILPGIKISNQHCTVEWDGRDTRQAVVTVRDFSTNGTYINGEKIGKGRYNVLREGNEIAFGSPKAASNPAEDYRYIYRHLAAGPPQEGLYAHYELVEQLGKGSFATVMKALHKETGRWYAVKMIQRRSLKKSTTNVQSLFQSITSDSALTREAKIMEKLVHPNICQLKEIYWDETYINLVLELVQGGDLLDHIISHEGLAEPQAQHITRQLCSALAYVHSQGIAHRDLKPENVLLTLDNPPIVKVADFGLAKFFDGETMLRTMCGTPSYLAPEVISGARYDHIVDSYSVGVIVFCMLSNTQPFIEPSTEDVRVKIRERIVDWNTLTARGTSPEAIDFIKALMEQDPAKRMTSHAALDHPWLRYDPPHQEERLRTQSPEPAPASIAIRQDVSMAEPSRANALEGQMSLDPVPGAYPSSQERPLQRRRLVIEEAYERGLPPALPADLIANVARLSAIDEADEARAAVETRPLKRKERENADASDSAEPDAMDAEPAMPATGAAKRGRGRGGRVTRGRGARPPPGPNQAGPSSETETVRRSNRLQSPTKPVRA